MEIGYSRIYVNTFSTSPHDHSESTEYAPYYVQAPSLVSSVAGPLVLFLVSYTPPIPPIQTPASRAAGCSFQGSLESSFRRQLKRNGNDWVVHSGRGEESNAQRL